jgi:hypothetical protein
VGADPRYFVSGCPPIYHGIVDLDIHHLDGAAHAVYLVCIHFASLSFLFLPRHNCRGVYLLPAFREAGLLVSVHLPTLDGGICGLVGSAKEIILKCLRDLRLDLGACKALSLIPHSKNDRGCRNFAQLLIAQLHTGRELVLGTPYVLLPPN